MYTIFDLETSTKESYKRKANPFDADNYIVATGIKHKGHECETYYMEEAPASWLDNTKILVGHNLGFDLSWSWRSAPLKAYLKRGGKIWCTQYAEYILTGQQAQWASLNECSEKYGGTQKVDEIKAMWQAGIDTIDIPKGMLLDYLDDDLNNTEIVYLAQVAQAKKLGMLKSLFSHMEALLGLTEMECNGLYIDQPTAEKQQAELEAKLEIVIETLQEYIPKALPAELEWNWSSKDHLSALLFGGSIKYKKRLPRLDEFGNNTYTKKKESWPVMGGVAVDPDVFTDSTRYDTYKGGAKAGSIKYKKVDVQGELKTSLQELTFDVQPWYTPKSEWETKKEGVYKTDEEVLNQIKESDSDLAGTMLQWRVLDKDLGTYYKRFDTKKGVENGMLTLIQPDGVIHHSLNNTATNTGRLSSSNPNCYSEDTEVLTDSGFKLFKDLADTDLVAQWDDGDIDFVVPIAKLVREVSEELVHIDAASVDLLVTKGHRILSTNRACTAKYVDEAGDLPLMHDHIWDRKFHRAGKRNGGVELSASELVLLEQAVCAQADGYLPKGTDHVSIACRSGRKRVQMERLWDGYTIKKCKHYHKVTVPRNATCFKYLEFTQDGSIKNFKAVEILALGYETLQKFIKFIHLWDGDYTRENTYGQITKQVESVRVVQAACALANISTKWYTKYRGELSDFNVVNMYYAPTRHASRTNVTYKEYVGKVYCVEVPSSFIVVRRNGMVVVSGNCQNISGGRKSEIKRAFSSRFGEDGVMVETDFSSMEVVGQGMLTQDPQLLADIMSGIDFHCVRGAKKLGMEYGEFLHKAKVEEDKVFVDLRQDAKEFSFQNAFGAGAAAIALATGMHIDDVKEFMKLEALTYPGVVDYNDRVKGEVLGNRRPTKVQLEVDGMTFNQGRGWHVSPTGKRYVFKEQIAPPFMRNPRNRKQAPVYTSFSPTQMKNYSVQGICGEIMLMCIGIAFREFNKRDNFGGRALLVNTVHDCIWLDCHKDVYKEAVTLLYGIMTSAHKYIEERYGFKPNVIFRAEAETGPNMLELHKFKLED